MKKWKDYTRQEKSMIVVILLLLLAILLSWGRIEKGIQKGTNIFYGVEIDSIKTNN